jgi:hypothetical protein
VTLLLVLLTELQTLLGHDDTTGDAASDVAVDPLTEMTGLTDAPAAPASLPQDPALARLLPDAYADDRDRAQEFRRFTEDEIRQGKREAARAVLGSLPAQGGRVVLDESLTDAWLGALNDLRLTLGTRLGVTEESYTEIEGLDPMSARARQLSVYLWLGWLQETLVDTQL